jgi:hypothetical protein
MAERPLGVTLICLLGFLGSILGILGGIGVSLLGGALGFSGLTGSGILGIIGIITLLISVASLVGFYWVWNMKKLGWTVIMVLEAINILLLVVSGSYGSLLIPGVVVIYLWMKKDLFG